VRMQRFDWPIDGDPQFGAAVSDAERIRLPRGDCR